MKSETTDKLKRQLGLIDVFSIASGAMISSGLFILPGLIYAKVGPAVILVYITAGLLMLPAMFAMAELTTAMPRAGGDYFFIERSMGALAGAMGGLASWFALGLKSAFALVGIGVIVSTLVPFITDQQVRLVAALICILFTVLNLYSVKQTGNVQVGLVLLLIGILIIYILRGMVFIKVNHYTPFFYNGTRTFFMATGMVFISYIGLTKVASVAEEVYQPKRTIPLGMIYSFIVVILIYVLSVFVTVGVMGGESLAASLIPLTDGGAVVAGRMGGIMLSFAALLAFISTANAGILAASRYPVAMSRDQMLPSVFASISRRYKTPVVAILTTGLFMTLMILFLNLENLVKVASSMNILLFIFGQFAIIIMRESRIMNYRPAFSAPLYPWIQIAGILCYAILLFSMGQVAFLTTLSFLLVSFTWAKLYVPQHVHSESALIHVMERITAREIAGNGLNTELREILKERDRIVEDRFDRLVKQGLIYDLPSEMELEPFFRLLADDLATRLNLPAGELFQQLLERERASTTAIRPGLAIPHITIPGEHRFEMVIVRCSSGISFEPALPPVYAVFVLLGTLDERNFHLRALSNIAQIVQNPDFDHDWLRARHTNELKDLLLLAKRHRE